jgi:hypothetical protein
MLEFLGNILLPSNLIILFFIIGAFLVITRKRRRVGGSCLACLRPFTSSLERGSYPHGFWDFGEPYKSLASTEGLKDVKRIVILAVMPRGMWSFLSAAKSTLLPPIA